MRISAKASQRLGAAGNLNNTRCAIYNQFSQQMVSQADYQGPLSVRVTTLQGQVVVVQTWGYRSVMQFKWTLSRLWGLDAEGVHLVYRDRVMDNDHALGSYMTHDATVILIPRLNSGFY